MQHQEDGKHQQREQQLRLVPVLVLHALTWGSNCLLSHWLMFADPAADTSAADLQLAMQLQKQEDEEHQQQSLDAQRQQQPQQQGQGQRAPDQAGHSRPPQASGRRSRHGSAPPNASHRCELFISTLSVSPFSSDPLRSVSSSRGSTPDQGARSRPPLAGARAKGWPHQTYLTGARSSLCIAEILLHTVLHESSARRAA